MYLVCDIVVAYYLVVSHNIALMTLDHIIATITLYTLCVISLLHVIRLLATILH
jgi:hypothetical protein